MISAKDLTDEQRNALEQWAAEGSQLAEVQQRLKAQFGLNVTYMDTRFLVLDLGIDLQPEAAEEPEGEADEPAEVPSQVEPGAPAPAGEVTVTADELPRSGAVASGMVTFSDGEKAAWFIDQMGRPGLDPANPDHEPSEADLTTFEQELRKLLEG